MRCEASSFWIPVLVVGIFLAGVPVWGQQGNERTVEGLLHDLRHPDPDRRAEAARLAGENEIRQAVPELIRLVEDPNNEVREAAAEALYDIRDPRALPAFVLLTGDQDTDIQKLGVDGIVDLYVYEEGGFVSGVKKVVYFLNPLSDDYDARVVEPYVPVSQDAVNALTDLLFSSDSGLRKKAAVALGILRAESALPAIEDALNRESKDDIKIELIRAIYKIGDTEGGEAVVPFIRDPDKKVHDEAILTAGRLKVKSALPILGDLYRVGVEERRKIFGFVPVSGSDDLQRKVLEALSYLGDPSSKDIFEDAIADERNHYRRYAAEGLGRVGDDSYTKFLAREYLREDSSEVRLAESFALFNLGREEHLVELVDQIDEQQAYYYLLEFEPSEVALLNPYLQSEDESTVIRLLDVVGLRGGPEAIPVVRELSRHEDADIVSAANLAIRRLQGRFP